MHCIAAAVLNVQLLHVAVNIHALVFTLTLALTRVSLVTGVHPAHSALTTSIDDHAGAFHTSKILVAKHGARPRRWVPNSLAQRTTDGRQLVPGARARCLHYVESTVDLLTMACMRLLMQS